MQVERIQAGDRPRSANDPIHRHGCTGRAMALRQEEGDLGQGDDRHHDGRTLGRER
jgi:hypothetical protein